MSQPVNDYVVALAAIHPRTGERTLHVIEGEGYTLQEAGYAALYEVDSEHAYNDQGYRMEVVSIRPATETSRGRLSTFLERLALLFARVTDSIA